MRPPPLASLAEHLARRRDSTFWKPYVAAVLERHDLGTVTELVAGYNATHPTFLAGERVVKLFGFAPFWREAAEAELRGHRLVRTDSRILAPELLATGSLFPGTLHPWPYLVTSRVSGVPWNEIELSEVDRRAVAADLGAQLAMVHALPRDGAIDASHWNPPAVLPSIAHTVFPPRLISLIEPFLAAGRRREPAFVHGDLVANHVFVDNGRLTAIIDWGDALVADRCYEIGKLHVDTFRGDNALLQIVVEAMGWVLDDQAATDILRSMFERQAMGLAQHHGFDIFHSLADLVPLQEIHDLDDLAYRLFEVRVERPP